MQHASILGLCGAAFALAATTPAAAESALFIKERKVTVVGVANVAGGDVASARDAAIRNAQRQAIEEVVGGLIESSFTAEERESIRNGVATHDAVVEERVFAKSSGYIERQMVLGEAQEGPTYKVTLEVVVRAASLAEELRQVQSLLAAAGNPEILLLVAERYTPKSGEVRAIDKPAAQALLESTLVDKRLPMVAREQGEALRARPDFAELLRNDARAAAACAELGADITILGQSDVRFGGFNEHNDNLYYVSATLTLRAIEAESGAVLASGQSEGRGAGVNEDNARQSAIKQAVPKAAEELLQSLLAAWRQKLARAETAAAASSGAVPAPAGAAWALLGTPKSVEVRGPGINERVQKLSGSEALEIEAKGPQTLELQIRALTKVKLKKLLKPALAVIRDAAFRADKVLALGPSKKPLRAAGTFASDAALVQVAVPAGKHRYTVHLESGSGPDFAMRVSSTATTNSAALLGPEAAIPGAVATPPPDTEVAGKATTQASSPSSPPPVAVTKAMSATPATTGTVTTAAATVQRDVVSDSTGATASSPPAAAPVEVVTLQPRDESVQSATAALVELLAKSFAKNGRPVAFHRVAVPRFQEIGADVAKDRLGAVVAELVAVQLSQLPPFVVVERDRLDAVMKEHRLKDLGLIDEATSAEFGKILGAQSIVSGSVAEAGPNYVVVVRQVDTESARVLASAQVSIARAGLVALSSEAVVLRSTEGAVFRSALIPGWGQFYNREPAKGVAFVGGAVGSLGTAALFFALGKSAEGEYLKNTPDAVDQRGVANDRYRVANIALIAYAVVWGANLIDAYLNGHDAEEISVPAGAIGGGGAAASAR